MRLLLDTHTLFWSADNPTKLSSAALAVIQDPANDRLLSAATIWELAIKVGLGKMSLSLPYRQWMEKAITDLKLIVLPITVEYTERQATLPPPHKDPFDRLMIAQALVDGIPIGSLDVAFDSYGITRIW
ncbi:MAG: type II toxin-antitoxin system VapC family toxin [Planctomycetes bacterium]|nr:type II toxin-antitoxin system VapC family toxin [Planctomycetota bacterium]